MRLYDEFSYFYLQWVLPHHNKILNGSDLEHWQKMYHSSAWQAWAGYAFENICLKHIKKIKNALGISAVVTQESHWFCDGDATKDGAQIDLLIDRADGCINLCEIKFCSELYTITKQYAAELIRKKEQFLALTGTRKAIFITMITPFGITKNNYANELVQSEVLLESLF